MDQRIEYIAWLTDEEFHGKSFNSAPLTETLKSLNAAQALSEETHEGFTVWRIVLHLAYWKYFFTKALGGEAGTFPFAEKNWPETPDGADDAAWAELLSYLEKIHGRYMDTLEALPGSKLDQEYTPWETPYWKLITWMSSHDLFHGAQIRNMGVTGLKKDQPEKVYS